LPIPILAASLVLSLLANSAAKGVPIEARELEAPADSLVLRKSSFVLDACRLIDRVARANAIPADYVARLISVESGFSPTAVSPKALRASPSSCPKRRAYAAWLILLNLARHSRLPSNISLICGTGLAIWALSYRAMPNSP
jgi:hypothetical protein